MIPTKWINAADLSSWANSRESQERLPHLLRLLVHATVAHLQKVGFPAGESVQMGGWDGVVETEEGNAFVPNGCSVWELGVNTRIKTKADADYKKRCDDSLGLSPHETTFVFVTLRRWAGKDKWVQEKNSEGIWAEVRAYDADDMEQWLELAPAVHAWLAQILGKWSDDFQDLSSWWDEWSKTTAPRLTPSLHLLGRDQQSENVRDWLNKSPSKLTIQGDSYEESLAFFAAIIYELSEQDRVQYLSRCVLVKKESSWRNFNSSQQSLILVPIFSSIKAIPQNHHVLIPIGREGSPNQDTIKLSRLPREGFINYLMNMNFSRERASVLSRESKRSLLLLRRLISSNSETHTPQWAKAEYARKFIPALIIGAWDETKEADRRALESLANRPYGDVINDLACWLNTSDSPIQKTGDVWQIVSHEILWHYLSRFIVSEDLDRFENLVSSVLGILDSQKELSLEQQFSVSLNGKELSHSSFIRQGIAETMMILSTLGLPAELQDSVTPQRRVSRTVRKLLNIESNHQLLLSLSNLLPKLAEAAPEEFLEFIEQDLETEKPTSLDLFQVNWLGNSQHIYLLWALETLAWEPIYLARVSIILAKLSILDPGGNITNRPFNSLCEIFKCWNPQTSAPFDKRLRILNTLLSVEPDVTWRLLCNLMPRNTGEISHPTYKPRWKDWGEQNQEVNWNQYWCNIDDLVKTMLGCVESDGRRLRDIVKLLELQPPNIVNKIVEFLHSIDTSEIQDSDLVEIWINLRNIVSRQKKFNDLKPRLSTEVINAIDLVHHRFEPQSISYKYAYVFDYNPYPIKYLDLDWQSRSSEAQQLQYETAKEVCSEHGLKAVLDIAINAPKPHLLGEAVAKNSQLNEDDFIFIKNTLSEEENKLNQCIEGFFRKRIEILGMNWAIDIINQLRLDNLSNEQLFILLSQLPFESKVWNIISQLSEELKTLYWKKVPAHWVSIKNCETAIHELLNIDRPYAALNLAGISLDQEADHAQIHPNTLIEILEKIAYLDPKSEFPQPDIALTDYYIEKVFVSLDASDFVNINKIAELEVIYFDILRHCNRQPKLLYQEISTNPDFFAELVKFLYRPEDGREEVVDNHKRDEIRYIASYKILKLWHQIPGSTEEGKLNFYQLEDWIIKARNACHESGRGKVGDLNIGQVLAYSPEGIDKIWPDIAVRKIVEQLKSKELEQGIEVGLFNKRGAWVKTIDEGGCQERQLAEQYRYNAAALEDVYPRTASMLRRVAEQYESDAHREDIRTELEGWYY